MSDLLLCLMTDLDLSEEVGSSCEFSLRRRVEYVGRVFSLSSAWISVRSGAGEGRVLIYESLRLLVTRQAPMAGFFY